ncbi:MAG TPA: bifunctional UDP-N-acetylmuramoyl-tripeptide:D-alanyl-D-alanine ligase/alanine racemase, partial [Bacteroidales bacterium]|nr:bifunctional UDP-N-acetylmuramoyl-tripeptide:D-alanyl-D-alanine ligase/alanine racemase [Bacteroidales bacterium]
MKYDINQIASILGVKDNNLYSAEISILLTDSRKLSNPSETLFFALETKNNDAHNFINELYDSGVRNFVVSKQLPQWKSFQNVNFIKVNNCLLALQKISIYHRSLFDIPIIGISGS